MVVLQVGCDVAKGCALWENYASLRQLAKKSHEQWTLYVWNASWFITFLLANVLPISSWKSWPLVPLFFVVASIFMRSRKEFCESERKLLKLKEKWPNVDAIHKSGTESPGLDLERLFPARDFLGEPTVEQRIERTREWVCSSSTKALYSVGYFLLMHVGDIIAFVTLAYSSVAIYGGLNVLGNTIQALCCLLCIAEHGLFWMNPTYDEGPLSTVGGGVLSRCVHKLSKEFRVVGCFVDYSSYGLFGRVFACVDLGAYLVGRCFYEPISAWVSNWVQCWVQHAMLGDLIERNVQSMIEDDVNLRETPTPCFTQKAFTVVHCQDPCPGKSVRQLEEELVACVENRWPHPAEAVSIRKMMDNRVFSKHVSGGTAISEEAVQQSLEVKAKKVLHNCRTAFEEGSITPLRAMVASESEMDSCPVAVYKNICDLYLDACVSSELGDDSRQVETFKARILQIFQQIRDKACIELLQGRALMFTRLVRVGGEESGEVQSAAVRRAYLQGVLSSRLPSGLGLLHNPVVCLSAYVLEFILNILGEVTMNSATNYHSVVVLHAVFQKTLGLSSSGQGVLLDPATDSLLSKTSLTEKIFIYPFLVGIFGPALKRECAKKMLDELVDAIANETDVRCYSCDLFAVKCAILKKAVSEKQEREGGSGDDSVIEQLLEDLAEDCGQERSAEDRREFILEQLYDVLLGVGLLEKRPVVERRPYRHPLFGGGVTRN